jgi:hypothetical protein
VNVPLFAAVLKQVHGYALQRILEEAKKLPARLGPPPASCTCSIQQSLGLPCYHTIWQRKLSSGVIYLEDIHPHWYFSRPEPGLEAISHPLPVLEPLVMQGRGRPRGALGTSQVAPTSTRQEPSAFELPSSSAPPALAPTTTERLYVVNSGLSRLQNGHQDPYKPGTQGERAYMWGLSSIWQTDLFDVATAAVKLMEREVISDIEGDDTIEVDIS